MADPEQPRCRIASDTRAERPGRIGTLLRVALQYLRFGAVGGAATLTHVATFVALIEIAGVQPMLANAIGFGIAVFVSFIGHFRWTFAPQFGGTVGFRCRARTALVRFVVVALIGLALNSLAVYLVVDVLALPYGVAILVMVGPVPGVVFALSKLWAFA